MERKNKIYIGIGILLFVLIAGNTIKVPYTAYAKEYEDKIVVVKEPISYQILKVWDDSDRRCGFLWINCDYWYYVNVKIRNTDIVGGVFKVDLTVNRADGGNLGDSASKFIAPYAEETFRFGGYKFDVSSYKHTITAPTKDVTKTENVEKNVPQTRYRTLFQEWGF